MRTTLLTEAAEAAASGRFVVGYVGATVPRTLIEDTGALAVQLLPEPGRSSDLGDALVEPDAPRLVREVFSSVVEGDWQFLQLLVIDRSATLLLHYLREVVRAEHTDVVPPLWGYDVIPTSSDAVWAYNVEQVRRLRARLHSSVGRGDPEACSRGESLFARVAAARANGRLSGTHAYELALATTRIGGADEANTILAQLAEPDANRARLGIVSSAPLRTPRLHDAVEEAGWDVVWEDSGAELLRPQPTAGAPIDEIAEWSQRVAAPRHGHPFAFRNAELLALTPKDVDGVLIHLPLSDTLLGWDVPRVRALLAERSIASVVLTTGLDEIEPAELVDVLATLRG